MSSDTTELVPVEAPGTPTVYELGAMSTQQLRGELARSLTMTARHLAYLAAIWRELENRGEDLTDLRTGLAVYLPQIAAGHLAAEAVIRFAGQPTVLRNIATLTIDQQRALADGQPVRVLTVNTDGDYESTELPAYALTAAQARLVFDAGKLRAPEEQRAILEAARVSAKRRTRPGPDGRVRYDSRTDQLRIGRSAASVGEVVMALREAAQAAQPDEADPDKAVIVKLTESEHRVLKSRAAEAGQSVQDYARAVLRRESLL